MRLPYSRFIRSKNITSNEDLDKLNQYFREKTLLPRVSLKDAEGSFIEPNYDDIIPVFEIPKLRTIVNSAIIYAWLANRDDIVRIAWELLKDKNIFNKLSEFKRYVRFFFDIHKYSLIDMYKFLDYFASDTMSDDEVITYYRVLDDPESTMSLLGLDSATPSPIAWKDIFWQARAQLRQLMKQGVTNKNSLAVQRLQEIMLNAFRISAEQQSQDEKLSSEIDNILQALGESTIEEQVDEFEHQQDISIDEISGEIQN